MSLSADPTAEVTDLLQHLIRNACVNDGTPGSGHEERSGDVLASYLEGTGLDLERHAPAPGRDNLVCRIEGSDPSAPSLLLMGHTDVVPVSPDRWSRDPFGGELVDGMVWGRGAIDMLNLTSSMAVAFRRLADEGFRPRGSLIYLAVADEEALGTYGAGWMLKHHRDAVTADFVVTEFGGMRMNLPTEGGPKLPVIVGEKGSSWCRIRVHGSPGHGSMPYRVDNALVKAAEVVRRLAAYEPVTDLHEAWRRFVVGAELPPTVSDALLDADRMEEAYAELGDPGMARMFHACTHTTMAPTVARAGVKTNVIPDAVDLEVDIRTLPGMDWEGVRAMLEEAIGEDLLPSVEIAAISSDPATSSPVNSPLWDALSRVTRALAPGTTTVPFMIFGATDARFFRRAGATAYGAGLFSDRISMGEFIPMFHGDDERIDQESLRLSTELWTGLARDVVG